MSRAEPRSQDRPGSFALLAKNFCHSGIDPVADVEALAIMSNAEVCMAGCDGGSSWGSSEQRHLGPCRARNHTLHSWHLACSQRPGDWNIIRDVTLVDLIQINASLDTSLLDNVTLHNLKRHGASPLFFWGCVFKHVKLSGSLSGIKINRSVGPLHPDQQKWDAATVAFYDTVEWALDISDAKFKGGCTFEAIPGHLIRRNPETQVLVTRDKLQASDWRRLQYDGTAKDIGLSWFLSESLFDSVVLAPRSDSKWAKRDLAVLNMLRSEGIAEPD